MEEMCRIFWLHLETCGAASDFTILKNTVHLAHLFTSLTFYIDNRCIVPQGVLHYFFKGSRVSEAKRYHP